MRLQFCTFPVLFSLLLTITVVLPSFQPVTAADKPAEAPAGIAVVELFTSEGCSSCPSADKLLAEIADRAKQRGLKVYCLGFHVDYWDKLGWPDRFSSKAFTQRQVGYRELMQLKEVYTPQMIVGGTREFLGNDGSKAGTVLGEALKIKPTAEIKLTTKPAESGKNASVKVAFEVTGEAENAYLQLALVEDGITSQVSKGENEGKKLAHVRVVRAFESISLAEAKLGEKTLQLPADLGPGKASLIAFVQQTGTGRIIGATETKLSASK